MSPRDVVHAGCHGGGAIAGVAVAGHLHALLFRSDADHVAGGHRIDGFERNAVPDQIDQVVGGHHRP